MRLKINTKIILTLLITNLTLGAPFVPTKTSTTAAKSATTLKPTTTTKSSTSTPTKSTTSTTSKTTTPSSTKGVVVATSKSSTPSKATTTTKSTTTAKPTVAAKPATTVSTSTAALDNLKSNIAKIDSTIKSKSTRIQAIDSTKVDISKEIANLEREIEEIKKEKKTIEEEIVRVTKNINYSSKSLDLSSTELNHNQQNLAGQNAVINLYIAGKNLEDIDDMTRVAYKNLVTHTENRVNKIVEVTDNISSAKVDIEKEKRELNNLKIRAIENNKKMEIAIAEKAELDKKLSSEKITHESDIKKLAAEKKRIESEIDRVIKERAAQAAKAALAAKAASKTPALSASAVKSKYGAIAKPLSGTIVTKYLQKKNGVASNGLEIRGTLGALVKSGGSGKVIYAEDFSGLGKVVMIEYNANLIGVYGNLISTSVSVGKSVKLGDQIGILGYSSEGKPDLYYELRLNLKPTNPESFF